MLLFSGSVVSDYLWPHERQHARLPCPSPSLRVCSNSYPLCPWCHATSSFSVVPFSCLQSFPASGSFLVSQLLPSGGQCIGDSLSASVLPMNIQDWFPLGWTGLISLQSKCLSKSSLTPKFKIWILQCSAFFIVQLSHLYMTTGKTIVLIAWNLLAKLCLYFLVCCLGWSKLFF